MRESIKHATPEEVHVRMKLAWNSGEITRNQTDLFFDVVDELTKRGELQNPTDDELNEFIEKTTATAARREAVAKSRRQRRIHSPHQHGRIGVRVRFFRGYFPMDKRRGVRNYRN